MESNFLQQPSLLFDAPIWSDFANTGPFDEGKLLQWNQAVGELAPVLNRTFGTSLAVRAIAGLLGERIMTAVESGRALAPTDIEALLGAIVTLASDLNRETCKAADAIEEALCTAP